MKIPFFNAVKKSEAEIALREWGVDYYRRDGGKLVVRGDLNLSHRDLRELPDLSNVIVEGSFRCDHNQLTSLKGAPCEVGKDYICTYNQLETLEGAPDETFGGFDCSDNALTSLRGAPKHVTHFYCDRNRLVTLEHAPDVVAGSFSCMHNQLTSLAGASSWIGAEFNCSHNQLETLEGGPARVGSIFSCVSNKLASLAGGPVMVGEDYRCDMNPLLSLTGAPTDVKKFSCTVAALTSLTKVPYFTRHLYSDFGHFSSWHDIPEALFRPPPGANDSLAQSATVLQSDMKASRRLTLNLGSKS